MDIEDGYPVLNGLQNEAAKNQSDAEDAQAAFG